MKKTIIILSLLVSLSNLVLSQSKINFDFSGAEKFYELCKNKNVDSIHIEELLALKSYKYLLAYLKSNWGKHYSINLYRNMLQVCFMPKKYKILDKYTDDKWILRYLLKLKQNPEIIRDYISTVKSNLKEDEILKRTKRYLPENITENQINVYFILGVNQGCASEDGVFIDSYYDITVDKVNKYLIPWIAHESHHFFRSQFNELYNDLETQHPNLFQAFYWLETEGLAEMAGNIHKNLPYFINSNENKNDIYRNFNTYILQLNRELKDYFANSSDGKKLLAVLNPPDLQNRYHEVGHLMAYYIEEVFGKEVLIDQIGKPLDFVLKYNEAAIKLNNYDGIPGFDTDVILNLKMLSTKYP